MSDISTIQVIGALFFALAILHTFATKFFEHLAHVHPRHSGIWHLLGEVEVVFGLWASLLILAMVALLGPNQATDYLESRRYTEPLFVFAIMVIAATHPVRQFTSRTVLRLADALPLPKGTSRYFMVLSLLPLMGSFITEPAAMTLAALILRDSFFHESTSSRLKYLTLGVLFVNISIGGTLTHFAAPPVLMVAAKWNWDLGFMFSHFGWKAAIAVTINAACTSWVLRKELANLTQVRDEAQPTVPASVVAVHLLFMGLVVMGAHHPPVFLGLFLLFLGFASAYPRHQSPLMLREALLVAFFLAGLVVLGGVQEWWLSPLLMGMDKNTVFFGTAALTALTDNAALTYLGSLVDGLDPEFKIALVAGAVSGGGLTIIANAPNPAGLAILKEKFPEASVNPLGLLIAALPPTFVAMLAFLTL